MICQAIPDGSPQDNPDIMVSSLILTLLTSFALALSNKQAAISDSTISTRAVLHPQYCRKDEATEAAKPPQAFAEKYVSEDHFTHR